MSHDQKPGKVRVVGGASASTRRRDDATTVGDATPTSAAVAEDAAIPMPAKTGGRLLAMLFVAGCAIGGAGLPLLRAL